MGLDFIVIGAQKGGTTSLWQYLREHPWLYMPASKEAPAFTASSADPSDFAGYMRAQFGDAPAGTLLGKVTPDYMVGEPDAPVDIVAERIASFLPAVKLIAILRDPIERAVSSYLMAVRRAQEHRSADAALCELLDPEQLVRARSEPNPTNSYLVAGEYGRMLAIYRDHFAADQLLVTFTEDLSRDPGQILDTVLPFLGLPPGYRPDDLETRHFAGGTGKLIDPESERLLFKFFRDQILPYMQGSPTRHRKAFEFFFETWNVAPDETHPPISAETRARLEAHFRSDAEQLLELGITAPWIPRWEAGATDD